MSSRETVDDENDYEDVLDSYDKNNFSRHKEHTKKIVKENPCIFRNNVLIGHSNLTELLFNNWILRGIFTILLISYFWLTIYLGPIIIMTTTLIIQVKCFSEIIEIGYRMYPVRKPPFFKLISWYFLVTANYFCCGETLVEHFDVFISNFEIVKLLANYHRFVSFCMYLTGVIAFMFSLRRTYDAHQFSLFAYSHVALLLIVMQSYMIVKNIFQGLIWLIIPVTCVVCNDITAYIFGKFFGRTPLIQLSPKKTWEGFIGAAISTILYGCLASHILCNYSYFVCPIEYIWENDHGTRMITECNRTKQFLLKNYTFIEDGFGLLKLTHRIDITTYPFIFDSFVLSLFCSIIAPFGGFFASGFKRAVNVKDFGGTIPGHGGVLDRFDCQFLVATFINVYITSFVKYYTPQKILSRVLYLDTKQQVQFFNMLRQSLSDVGGNASLSLN